MEDLKLDLGCASRSLSVHVNIDLDTIEEILARYANVDIPQGLVVLQYDIVAVPYADGAFSEIRSDSMTEHLFFLEEKAFFLEIQRVLRWGGKPALSVSDCEDTVHKWLAADDDWRDFYRKNPEAIALQHWFGQFSYSTSSRWGHLTASIFGPQNSEGQFHKNCNIERKIRAML